MGISHLGNLIWKSFIYTRPNREQDTIKTVSPIKKKKKKDKKRKEQQLVHKCIKNISEQTQQDKKHRCKLTKPSSVGRCWKTHHWKCLMLRKKLWKVILSWKRHIPAYPILPNSTFVLFELKIIWIVFLKRHLLNRYKNRMKWTN